jgi:hypothetical protein
VLLVDQGLSSASNFAVAAAAGHVLAADGFGRFALLLLAISTVVNLARAVWHEPDLADSGRRGDIPGPGRAALAALTVLAVAGADATRLGAGRLDEVGDRTDEPTVALVLAALAVVTVVANDRARYRAMTQGRTGSLLIADGAWLVVVVMGLAGVVPLRSASDLLVLWLTGAALASVVLNLPDLDASRFTADGHNDSGTTPPGWLQGRRLAILVDFLLFAGMTQVGGLVLGGFLPFEETASLRGAIIVFGPVGVLTGALATWVFADISRHQQADTDTTRRVGAAASMVAAIGLAAAAIAALVPTAVGEAVLGSGWPPRSVLVIIGLAVACQALSTPAMMLLRVRNERRRLLTLRTAAFAGFAATTIGLSVTFGTATATAVGYLVTNASFTATVWWSLLRRGTTKRTNRCGPPSERSVQPFAVADEVAGDGGRVP